MKNSCGAAERKEVVIIGNGPSAITLSYFLAGNWPIYPGGEGHKVHPNEYLHKRLVQENLGINDGDHGPWKEILEPGHVVSLVQQDLSFLCNGLEGRSINPVSVLMDTLQHPEADFVSDSDTCLEWKHLPHREIDHVVLGQGSPGGTWNRMEDCDDTLTVSVASWMSLPSLPINDWMTGYNNNNTTNSDGRRGSRVGLGNVSRYYKEYVKVNGLEKYFENNSLVTKLSFDDHTSLWKVSGWKESSGPFNYFTPRVVLATGNSDSPNRLDIPGEDLPFVFHSINDLEHILSNYHKSRRRGSSMTGSNVRKSCGKDQGRVLIVGAGLTAADAIITCKNHGVDVIHVFRKHPDDPSLIFNQLPENMYPEYHDVHSQMKGGNSGHNDGHCPKSGYKPFSMHSIVEIRKNKEIILRNLITSAHDMAGDDNLVNTPLNVTVKVSHVLVLIGKRADLSFIKCPAIKESLPLYPGEPLNPRNNPVRIDPFSHECISSPFPGLYAMGPLVGDNFVRFLQGAALAICNHIWKGIKTSTSSMTSSCPTETFVV